MSDTESDALGPATLVDLVRESAGHEPGRTIYEFLDGPQAQRVAHSCEEIDLRARAVALKLQQRVEAGDRVLLVCLPGIDFVSGFLGCLFAGVVAVPVYPPDPNRLDRTLPRLKTIVRDADVSALVTGGVLAQVLPQWLGDAFELPDIAWIDISDLGRELGEAAVAGWQAPEISADTVACLQYSSGSTSTPKGVILRHGNLLANLEGIQHSLGLSERSRGVSWLPPYHDMGLVGSLLSPIYARYPVVSMSPLMFLERPARWLQLISQTRATISVAPNFAFELAVKKVSDRELAELDLSSWEVALCGAEPIDPGTIERFVSRFGPAGLRHETFTPAYGLAEATLLVSGGQLGEPALTQRLDRGALEQRRVRLATEPDARVREVVSCGVPTIAMRVEIVDPESLRRAPEGSVGEIWVSSPSVCSGYWNDPEESARTFGAKIQGEDDGHYLRTGDLGFLHDGELYVSGRIKDLVVIRGRNVHPEDVELSVAGAHPSIRRGSGAAFSVAEGGGERLVVVQELRPSDDLDPDDVIAAIRRVVAQAHQVSVHAISLVEPGTIPKTSSGKIQRHATRNAFLAGELDLFWEWRDRVAPDPQPSGQAVSRLQPAPAFGGAREEASRDAAEPIAIVGMSCRLPGAGDPEALWELLDAEQCAISEIPPSRWDADAYYDPTPGTPGRMNNRRGGFVGEVEGFDTGFFGISPREAQWMDPQQRLMLEVVWEALEDGGWPASELAGSRTGVFIGVGSNDYSHLFQKLGQLELITPYTGTGNAHSIFANRLSYQFDLRGPSMAVDTACSSALVALHLACRSIRSGESDAAIVGGVNLILTPDISIAFSQARMLAPDGLCKSFDAGADGYVRSEGCVGLLLKPLSSAVRDGDRVLGVVRGSAVNQDGRTTGITVPNPEAQQDVLARAMAEAEVGPDEIGYVEAHGTGTAIGDPAEFSALSAIFGSRQPEVGPCFVGSVKANIGHTETASGLAGLAKVLLSFDHEAIPAQIHIKEINPALGLERAPLEIPLRQQAWPRSERPRIASVSSFGFGGTNAHAIIEEPPRVAKLETNVASESVRDRYVVTLSGRSEEGLTAAAGALAATLHRYGDEDLPDIAHTLNLRRTRSDHRAAISASSVDELRDGLAALVAGSRHAALRTGTLKQRATPKVAFLFTGQGSQYAGMARTLYETHPAFRRSIDACCEVADELLDQPLLSVLFGQSRSPEDVDQTRYTQPALFAVEYAMAQLWRSWGVEPSVLIGHSVGEFAAACVAGTLSLQDSLLLICERGRLMQEVRSEGAMLSVAANETSVRELVRDYKEKVSVAAVNGPESVVISGAVREVSAIEARLTDDGVATTRLQVSHAFHSPLMEPVLAPFADVARSVRARPPQIPLVSNLTGELLGTAPDADYWCRHIAQPVEFWRGMQAVEQTGCSVYLEVGPHPTLIGLARSIPSDSERSWVVSLRRKVGDWTALCDAIATLFCEGVEIDWSACFDEEGQASPAGRRAKRRLLTPAPFARERFGMQSLVAERGASVEGAGPSAGSARVPLLGKRLRSALDVAQFESQVSVVGSPNLKDHRIHGSTILPASYYLCMASAAARELFPREGPVCLQNVSFHEAFFVGERRTHLLQLTVDPAVGSESSFAIHGRAAATDDEASWTHVVTGSLLTVAPGEEASAPVDELFALRARCRQEVPVELLYPELAERGLQYGRDFRCLERVWRGHGEALGRFALPEEFEAGADGAPGPALLDACFQTVAATLTPDQVAQSGGAAYVPVGIDWISLPSELPTVGFSACRLQSDDAREELRADLVIFAEDGRRVGEIRGLRLLRFGANRDDADALEECLYQVGWRAAEPLPDTTRVSEGRWLVLADRRGFGADLQARLSAQGASAICVYPEERPAAEERPADASGRSIDPSDPAALVTLLRESFEGEPSAADHIVYLWALDAPAFSQTEPDFARAEELGALAPMHLAQAIVGAGWTHPPQLSLVTRGVEAVPGQSGPTCIEQALLRGVGSALALEHPKLRLRHVDLPGAPGPSEVDGLLRELVNEGEEDRIALRAEGRFVARLESRAVVDGDERGGAIAVPATPRFNLVSSAPGRLDRLRYRPAERQLPPPGTVEIEVEATGLNFRDVLNAMGLYPGDPIPYGGECAGRVSAVGEGVDTLRVGDEVVAIAPDSFANYVLTEARLVVPKPSTASFAESATIPITFLTADYALNYLGRLEAGQSVLIHAGAGGVGMAAIQLAQRAGARIFATAGSEEKRDLLRACGVEHVMDSRTLDFADEVLEITGGRGVDLLLNSLPGPFIGKGLSCLAPFGHFLEIGRTDIYQNRPVGLLPFKNNLSYSAIDLEKLCRERPELARTRLQAIVRAFDEGALEPLPHTVYPAERVVDAFRHMARRRNVGKVVVAMRQSDSTEQDRTRIRPDATYLVTGGLGDLGLVVAAWLVERGARHLVLCGRSGAGTEAQKRVDELCALGARVVVETVDVADREGLAALLARARENLPPLAGVFHAAGVLDDALLFQMQDAQMSRVLAPKLRGAWLLHELTQPDELDLFVLFSSVASVMGSPGQANYCAANAFLDALAHLRRSQSQPGLSINWGPWADIGMAARPELERALASRGMRPLAQDTALDALATALELDAAQVVVADVDWSRLVSALGQSGTPPLLREIPGATADASGRGDGDGERGRSLLALDPAERLAALAVLVQQELAAVMAIEASGIDLDEPLSNLGLDSLMALELKDSLEAALGITLGLEHLVEDPSVQGIAEIALDELAGGERPEGD